MLGTRWLLVVGWVGVAVPAVSLADEGENAEQPVRAKGSPGEMEPFEASPAPYSVEAGATDRRDRRSERERPRGPFGQGKTRLNISLGSGTTFNSSYLIAGLGAGYYVLDGLAIEVDGSAWIFGDPFVATVTPGVRYVFHMVPKVKPYLGAFVRHYFVEDLNDFDTWGGRGGLYLTAGENAFFGAGALYERRFDCDERQFRESCDQWYPEVSFALTL